MYYPMHYLLLRRCLEGAYEKEQRDYYLMSSHWCELAGDQVIGQPAAIKHLDLHTCTIEDSLGVNDAPFHFTAPQPTVMSGFAGWFEVDFAGSNELACRSVTTVMPTPPACLVLHGPISYPLSRHVA